MANNRRQRNVEEHRRAATTTKTSKPTSPADVFIPEGSDEIALCINVIFEFVVIRIA